MRPYSVWNLLPWLKIPVPIQTQNSFTYLSTALGSRNLSGDYANISDTSAVDPNYKDGYQHTLGHHSALTSRIHRSGDYDVFRFVANSTTPIIVRADRTGGKTVDPVLFVYDSNGSNLLSFNDDASGSSTFNSRINFTPQAGSTYNIVVGSYNGVSVGDYYISVSPVYSMKLPDPWSPFDPYTWGKPATTTLQTAGSSELATGMTLDPADIDQVMAKEASSSAGGLRETSELLGPPARSSAEDDLLAADVEHEKTRLPALWENDAPWALRADECFAGACENWV
jgi:hypothetical protein